ncbi:MAG: T9SS type A sorting domain-containing protein [Bacteroidales bacterium]|nr:T9SS type A sorting domain-containing protein [Bacteroidales bacterium]
MKKIYYTFLLLLALNIGLNAQYKASEDFESYAEGSIHGLGSATDGWGGSWDVQGGTGTVISGTPTGKQIDANGGPTIFRNLQQLYPGTATNGVYWIGFNITNSTAAWTGGWGGLSLFRDGNELFYMGKKDDGFGTGSNQAGKDSTYWVVVRIKNRWNDETKNFDDPEVKLWLNPIADNLMDGSEPDETKANITEYSGNLKDGFNRIRIASAGDVNLRYDNIRVGRSFAAVDYQTPGVEGELEALNIPTPKKAADNFDAYVPGEFLAPGNTNIDGGWAAPWANDGGEYFKVVAGNMLNYASGNHVENTAGQGGYTPVFRNFANKFSAGLYGETRQYWLAFDYQNRDATQGAWSGVSLYKDGDEKLFIGHPGGDVPNVGIDGLGGGVGRQLFSEPFDAKGTMLITIFMYSDGRDPYIYAWFNPDNTAVPDTATAPVKVRWPNGKFGFNRVRIAGNSDDGITSVDNFAIGNSYSEVVYCNLEPVKVTLKDTANSTTKFYLSSNTFWSLTSDSAWVSFDKTSGFGNDTITLTATTENTSIDSRLDTIRVSYGGSNNLNLPVEQFGKTPILSLLPKTLELNATAGSNGAVNISVSYTDWTISGLKPWLTASAESGSDNATVTFTASANYTLAERFDTVVVSGTGVDNDTIFVTQKAATPALSTSPSLVRFEQAANLTLACAITSTIEWTASTPASWISLSAEAGEGNVDIDITAQANTGDFRVDTITVTGGGITKKVVVKQASVNGYLPSLVVTDNFNTYTADGQVAGNKGGTGWKDAWSGDANTWVVKTGNLNNDEEGNYVESVQGFGFANCFRSFEESYTAFAGQTRTYWLSFDFKYTRVNANGGSDWGGVSLYNNNDEILFLGHPTSAWTTLGASSVGTGKANFSANYEDNALLVCCIVYKDGQDPYLYGWSNPSNNEVPDTANAEVKVTWPNGVNGFNRVRFACNSNTGLIAVDNFSLGNSYNELLCYTPYLSSSPIAFTLKDTANSVAGFKITSNTSWSLANDSAWIALDKTSGFGSDTVVIKAITENTATTSRRDTIRITYGDNQKLNLPVEQYGQIPMLLLSADEISLNAAAGSAESVNLTASYTSWSLSGLESWLTASEMNGNADAVINFTAEANTTSADRIANVIISGTGIENDTIVVTQKAPALTLSTDSIIVGAAAGSGTFDITSNADWTIAFDQSWLTVSEETGSLDLKPVTVNVVKNIRPTERIATITVAAQGVDNKTVIVKQAAANVVLVTDKTIVNVDSTQLTGTFKVFSNINWKVTALNPRVSVDITEGADTADVTFTLQPNTTSDFLYDTVLITGTGADTVMVRIKQEKTATVGISSNFAEKTIVYPNPTKGTFIVRLSNNVNETNIYVYNLVGAIVKYEKAFGNNTEVDISGLTNGVYFVKVIAGTKIETIKIVKE